MDTSKAYVKMCDCPEIQGHIPKHGDYYDGFGWIDSRDKEVFYQATKTVWLPRQDQLQEMMSEPNPYATVLTFSGWYSMHCSSEEHEYESMEQLWLAFVMARKHGKVWSLIRNGVEADVNPFQGEWVKPKEA